MFKYLALLRHLPKHVPNSGGLKSKLFITMKQPPSAMPSAFTARPSSAHASFPSSLSLRTLTAANKDDDDSPSSTLLLAALGSALAMGCGTSSIAECGRGKNKKRTKQPQRKSTRKKMKTDLQIRKSFFTHLSLKILLKIMNTGQL